MRYRLCIITDKYPEYYWPCFTSIDDALSHPRIRSIKDKATKLSTGNANEHVFVHNNFTVILLDETHPSFNLNIFHLEDWEIENSRIPEDTLFAIDDGVKQLILNVVKDL